LEGKQKATWKKTMEQRTKRISTLQARAKLSLLPVTIRIKNQLSLQEVSTSLIKSDMNTQVS